MKKNLLIIAALIVAVYALANNHTIIIRGSSGEKPINTSVIPGSLSSDTLNVIPSHDVDSIYITLKDAQDNILYYNCVPAAINDHFTIISPPLHQGLFLEIRDDQGFFYWEFDD